MKTFTLLKSIQTELIAALSDWKMETPTQGERPPKVVIGQLANAPDGGQKELVSDAPFVIVRLTDGELSDGLTANVSIICGLYRESSQQLPETGVKDVLDLIDRIAITLKSKQWWSEYFFELQEPITFIQGLPNTVDPYEVGLQADAPYFICKIQTSFYRRIECTMQTTSEF